MKATSSCPEAPVHFTRPLSKRSSHSALPFLVMLEPSWEDVWVTEVLRGVASQEYDHNTGKFAAAPTRAMHLLFKWCFTTSTSLCSSPISLAATVLVTLQKSTRVPLIPSAVPPEAAAMCAPSKCAKHFLEQQRGLRVNNDLHIY